MMPSLQEMAMQNQMQQPMLNQLQPPGGLSGGGSLSQLGQLGMFQTVEKVITIRFLQHGYNVIVTGVSVEQDGMHAFESPSNLIMFIDKLVKQERP